MNFIKRMVSAVTRHRPGEILEKTQGQYDLVKGQVRNLERKVLKDWEPGEVEEIPAIKRKERPSSPNGRNILGEAATARELRAS